MLLKTSEQPFVLLNDGCKIPQFGFGVGGVPSHQAEARATQAIEAGYTLFDTAAIYGNEEALGRAIRSASSAGRPTHGFSSAPCATSIVDPASRHKLTVHSVRAPS